VSSDAYGAQYHSSEVRNAYLQMMEGVPTIGENVVINSVLLGALLAGSVQLGAPALHKCPPQTPLFPCQADAVAGTGTISPGLPCTGCAIDFNFTAVAAGSDAGVYTGCVFHGTSSGTENELGGAGSGILSGCGISGNVNYVRVGAVVQISGSAMVNGTSYTVGPNAFIFIPTSVAPTTSFIVVGAVELG
jgi:hypothetical protein